MRAPTWRSISWVRLVDRRVDTTARGDATVSELLLDRGADPNARQGSGWTPLHSAAHNGDGGTVALLLARGADAAATNDQGATVLSMAEESGKADVIARVRDTLSAS